MKIEHANRFVVYFALITSITVLNITLCDVDLHYGERGTNLFLTF